MIAMSVRMEKKARKNHIQQTHTHIYTHKKKRGGREIEEDSNKVPIPCTILSAPDAFISGALQVI